jgi:hypothetical protein
MNYFREQQASAELAFIALHKHEKFIVAIGISFSPLASRVEDSSGPKGRVMRSKGMRNGFPLIQCYRTGLIRLLPCFHYYLPRTPATMYRRRAEDNVVGRATTQDTDRPQFQLA